MIEQRAGAENSFEPRWKARAPPATPRLPCHACRAAREAWGLRHEPRDVICEPWAVRREARGAAGVQILCNLESEKTEGIDPTRSHIITVTKVPNPL